MAGCGFFVHLQTQKPTVAKTINLNDMNKKTYNAPDIRLIEISIESQLLAASYSGYTTGVSACGKYRLPEDGLECRIDGGSGGRH